MKSKGVYNEKDETCGSFPLRGNAPVQLRNPLRPGRRPPPQEGTYTAGTYEAGADGRNGPVKVSVTFTAEAIEKVEIVEHTETAGIAEPAIAGIPGENAAKK